MVSAIAVGRRALPARHVTMATTGREGATDDHLITAALSKGPAAGAVGQRDKRAPPCESGAERGLHAGPAAGAWRQQSSAAPVTRPSHGTVPVCLRIQRSKGVRSPALRSSCPAQPTAAATHPPPPSPHHRSATMSRATGTGKAQGKSAGKGKAPGNPLTASQLYLNMVSRNELAQMSVDELHRGEAFAASQAGLSSDTLATAGAPGGSFKQTKRHDGASYLALGVEDGDSEEETGLLDDETPDQSGREKPRIPGGQPGFFTHAHRAIDEWVISLKETYHGSRRVRTAIYLSLFVVGVLLVGSFIGPERRAALSPWKSTSNDDDKPTSPEEMALPASPGPVAPGTSGDGTGLLDLRPGEDQEWYKAHPGAMATGALPFWASAAALPTGAQSYTRGKEVIQTALAGDEAVQSLAPFDHMGPLTPYKSAPGFGVDNARYRDVSALMHDAAGQPTCTVDQVHILHRHGARYPTAGSPVHAIQRLAAARDAGSVTFNGPLAFLQSWSYQLGGELLTPPGRLQLYHSGVQAHMQYAHLVGEQHRGAAGHAAHVSAPASKRHNKLEKRTALRARQWGGWSTKTASALLVRAGSQRRIVDSALSWLQGFYGPQLWNDFALPPASDLIPVDGAIVRPIGNGNDGARVDLQVHPEAPGWNTSLASNFACAAAARGNTTTAALLKAFKDAYLTRAVERLQPHVTVKGGAAAGVSADADAGAWDGKLTPSLLNGMQQMCAYETVAFGQSSFCHLFTAREWEDYERLWDMQFHGYDGAGTPIGAAQGAGWVNEMLARLTNKPWDDSLQTSENTTVNSDPSRFPTDAGQRVFVDFTHDSILTSVLAALGTTQLNTLAANSGAQAKDSNARFRTSHIVPFAARMVFERLSCGANPDQPKEGEHYIRMLLNDAVVPLASIGCENRPDGLCSLNQFTARTQLRTQQIVQSFPQVCGAWRQDEPLTTSATKTA